MEMLHHHQSRSTSIEDDAYCHESNVPTILAVTGVFTGAAVITVFLRIWVRSAILKFIGPDDYMMVAAAVMAIATFICFVGESYHGIGQHMSCVSLASNEMVEQWTFFHAIWVMFGVVFVKISIAFFLMRLAPKEAWRQSLWAAIGKFTHHPP